MIGTDQVVWRSG